jgi:hypothetical protein
LVSPEEGEAVVWVAWELRRGLASKPDCSHFVNLVYTRAGLDYEYANTDTIFDGIDAFRRIQDPQPGDLVAWKGHVGLIVDPDEHLFYSSVRSGFAIENYHSDYWMNRGQPRFYRYLIDDVHSARLAAHLNNMPLAPLPAQSFPISQLPPSQLSSEAESNLPSARTSPTRTEAIDKRPVDDTEIFDAIFVSPHAKPSKEEVRAALIHFADSNGERVQLPALRSNRALVVVEHLSVDEMSVDEHSGWAELEVGVRGSFRCGQKDHDQTATKWRVAMRRDERGWILLAPRDRIYLRREQVSPGCDSK